MKFFRKLRTKLPPSDDTFYREFSNLSHKLDVLEKKLDLYAMQLYAKEAETDKETRMRFFRSIPDASGVIALYQAVNTKLLCELIRIMDTNNLNWWMWSGSLIAAVARGKAIPWDDDIDICMMREDFELLRKQLKNNQDFQLTEIYSFYSQNRTYRFVSSDKKIFNFIDIVPCDWASEPTPENDAAYKKIHKNLVSKFETSTDLKYWRSHNHVFSKETSHHLGRDMSDIDWASSEHQMKIIDRLYEEAFQTAVNQGILCNKSSSAAVAYGLDNMFDKPNRKDIWSEDVVFPTHQMLYENILVNVPNKEEDFAEICFPGWPYVPNDICGHSHIPNSSIETPDVQASMLRFLIGNSND